MAAVAAPVPVSVHAYPRSSAPTSPAQTADASTKAYMRPVAVAPTSKARAADVNAQAFAAVRPPAVPQNVQALAADGSATASSQMYSRTAAAASQAQAAEREPSAPAASAKINGPQDALFEYSQKLSHRVTVLEAELSHLREERDNLKAENEAIGEHIFGLQQENGMLHDIGWTSYLEKAQLAKAAEGVSTDASHLRTTIQDQKSRIDFLVAENKTQANTIETLKSDRVQLHHQIRGLEVTLETVQTDLQKRIARETALKERGLNLERCLEEVQGDKVRLDDVVSLQHVEIAKMKQISAELNQERARSHTLEQRGKSMEAQLAQLHHEKVALDSQVGTLHVEVAQLVTQRDSALTEVPQLQGTVRQQTSAVAELQDQVRHLQASNHDLQRHNLVLDQQVKEYFSLLEESRGEVERNAKCSAMLLQEKNQMRRQFEDVSAKRGELDHRLNSVMSQKGIVHAHFEQVSTENNQLQMAVQQAQSENAALRSRLTGMEKMVQGYQDEVANLQQRTQVLRNEREELQEHVQSMQPQRLEGRFVMQGAL